MSWRERVTKSACASLLATSVISAAGEGRGRVSTTLMSDVLCIGSREEARIEASRKGFWGPRPAGSDSSLEDAKQGMFNPRTARAAHDGFLGRGRMHCATART